MIDLSLDELDQAIVEALERVLVDAGGPGWKVQGETCALDSRLWMHLTGLLVGDPAAPPDERPSLLTCELAAERLGGSLVGLPLIDHLVGLRLLEAAGEGELRVRLGAAPTPLGLVTPAEQTRVAQPAICLSGAIAGSLLRLLPDGAVDWLDLADEKAPYVPNLGDLPVGRIAATDPRWTSLGEVGPDVAEIALAERKVLVCGALAGICDRALTLAVDYAKERQLFGAPIGSFQSLAHGLAAAKLQADGSQLLAREAAWARDNEPRRFIELSRMAYGYASAAGDYVTRAAVHVFGGYGLTREYPAQDYYRMARALTLFIGDRRFDVRNVGYAAIDRASARQPVGA